MGLFIETGTVPFELEGETLPIRVLTARERLRVMRKGVEIADMVTGYGPDDAMPTSLALKALDGQFEILLIGLDLPEEEIDRIPAQHWPTIATEITRVNGLTETDAEN